jgi:serine/threonine-protein kinase RsbW
MTTTIGDAPNTPDIPDPPSDSAARRPARKAGRSAQPAHSEFAHRSWPAEPGRLPGIRSAVRSWLRAVGLSDQAQQDVLLAVNEAATNAVEHAYPSDASGDTVDITFWTEPDHLWIQIDDHGHWKTPATGPTGRGLGIPMMQRLVDSIMIKYGERGTSVLVGHALPGEARELPAERATPISLSL